MATEAGTGTAAAPINPLAMSDEDFLKVGIPENLGKDLTEEKPKEEDEQDPNKAAAGTGGAEGAATDGDKPTETPAPADGADGTAGAAGKEVGKEAGKEAEGEKKPDAAAGADPAAATAAGSAGSAEAAAKPTEGSESAGEAKPPNYEDFYKKVMTPFKANGKTVELRSPEEAVQLMQMGANYTRKMQELVPHRKALTMLQSNGLLDEGKLSFLIDLDKKNPEAIKKLIKDSGIDPLEIDTSVEPAYLEGSHRVTDEEVNFRTSLEELSSTQEGKETLQDINTRWDQTSKELLWKHPQTMALIDQQRRVGIYGRICDEMDRRKTLGTLPMQTPFLEAYKIVGDELTAANAFADLAPKPQDNAPQGGSGSPGQGTTTAQPEAVATRVAAPKSQVANDDRASAASSSRGAAKPATQVVNPLAMADDEFMKSFAGRL